MPRYIRLARLTEEGIKNVGRLNDLLAEARKVFEANGAKIVDSYSSLGRYDLVAIVEAPDNATMMKISALVARQGYIRAETLPAVPTPDFAKSVAGAK